MRLDMSSPNVGGQEGFKKNVRTILRPLIKRDRDRDLHFRGEKYVEISLESSAFLLLTARWRFERHLEIQPTSQSFKVVDSYGYM